MESVTNGHRAGHGFPGLRKRYIRRAQFLAQDNEFRAYLNRFRDGWNRDYPQYEVKIADASDLSNIPQHLMKDWREHRRQLDDRIVQHYEGLPRNGAINDELIDDIIRQWQLIKSLASNGMDIWIALIDSAARRYFAVEDFPNPYPNNSHPIYGNSHYFHPAHRFLGIALQTDPRLITDFESLFDPMVLEPIDLFTYGPGSNDYVDEAAGETLDDESPDEQQPRTVADLQWYLPLYPGITEADIRRAGPEIVRRINEIYGSRTASARVIALRTDGCTHREIANRLGLTEQTVAAILKKSGQ